MAISKLGPSAQQPQNSPAGDTRNQDVLRAARLYENQFLREMVREMKKTVPENEFMPKSMAEKIFSEQLDDNYVDNWVETGGIGFADVIYDQVMEKFGPQQVPGRPRGPVPFDQNRHEAKPMALRETDITYKIQPKPDATSDSSNMEVSAPWGGEVLMARPLEHGLQSLLLDHGQGLKSSLVYKGSLLTPEQTRVEAGQRIGLLSPENQGILWRIQR